MDAAVIGERASPLPRMRSQIFLGVAVMDKTPKREGLRTELSKRSCPKSRMVGMDISLARLNRYLYSYENEYFYHVARFLSVIKFIAEGWIYIKRIQNELSDDCFLLWRGCRRLGRNALNWPPFPE